MLQEICTVQSTILFPTCQFWSLKFLFHLTVTDISEGVNQLENVYIFEVHTLNFYCYHSVYSCTRLLVMVPGLSGISSLSKLEFCEPEKGLYQSKVASSLAAI